MRISDWSSDVCSSDLIEIGKGFGEAEQLTIVVPVTVPAHVPAFDQNAADTVLSGKIDVALRFFGRGAVDAVMAPASLVDVPRPPDADILTRFDPRYIATIVGAGEVAAQPIITHRIGIWDDVD